MNALSAIEEPVSKKRISKHTREILLETVFFVRGVQRGYKEELIEFRVSS
jgi:hypothetical protein